MGISIAYNGSSPCIMIYKIHSYMSKILEGNKEYGQIFFINNTSPLKQASDRLFVTAKPQQNSIFLT